MARSFQSGNLMLEEVFFLSYWHVSTIGNILNLATKSISPQFHVVYDDYFTTTGADGNVEPQEWQDLLSHSRDWALEDEVSSGPELAAEWLDEQERASEQLLRNIRSGPTMLPEMYEVE